MNDPFSSLKELMKSGDQGDVGAACLGFAAGLIIDVALHGTSLGTAAVAGATGAVGVKRSVAAFIESYRGGTGAPRSSRRQLAQQAASLDRLLRENLNLEPPDSYRYHVYKDEQERLQKYRKYFKLRLVDEEEFDGILKRIFGDIRGA